MAQYPSRKIETCLSALIFANVNRRLYTKNKLQDSLTICKNKPQVKIESTLLYLSHRRVTFKLNSTLCISVLQIYTVIWSTIKCTVHAVWFADIRCRPIISLQLNTMSANRLRNCIIVFEISRCITMTITVYTLIQRSKFCILVKLIVDPSCVNSAVCKYHNAKHNLYNWYSRYIWF